MMQRCGALILGVLLATFALASLAQAPYRHYWYDGAVKRPLYLDEASVAQFDGTNSARSDVLRPKSFGVQSLSSASPVFREYSGGREKALPGGVLVTFPPGTRTADASAVLANLGVVDARSIGDMGHVWFIPTRAGIESLELANRLFETGAFESAAPNWREERRPQ